jgi:hypothetical protein
LAVFSTVIARQEHGEGRALLPVLVVPKAQCTPGPGLYALAREMGLLHEAGDGTERRFFEQERQRVYDAWR